MEWRKAEIIKVLEEYANSLRPEYVHLSKYLMEQLEMAPDNYPKMTIQDLRAYTTAMQIACSLFLEQTKPELKADVYLDGI